MVCIAGESGGGNLVLNVARRLADKDESDLVKFVFCSTPISCPHELGLGEGDTLNEVEEIFFPLQNLNFMCVGGLDGLNPDYASILERDDIFPVLIKEEVLKKFPKCILATGEFDFLRRSTE